MIGCNFCFADVNTFCTLNTLWLCNDCRLKIKVYEDVMVAVPLKIIGKERARVVVAEGKKARAYTPDRTVAFESDFALAVASKMPKEPWAGAVRMETTIFVPHKNKGPCVTKPDIDNALKAILDSLKGRAYKDDCQVWRETTEKLYAPEPLIKLRMYFDDITFEDAA